jgi:hypothetical protein
VWRALALALVLAPPAEHARDVVWSGPAECPARQAVIERIVELDPETGAGQLVARGEVVRVDAETLRLDVSIETESGVTRREVEAGDCGALADAFAVLVTVAVSPEPERPSSVEALEPKPSPEVEVAPTPKGVPPPGGVLKIAPFAEFGVAPRSSGGPIVFGGIAWPRFRLLLGASWSAPRLVRYGGPDSGVAVQLATSHLQVCPGRTWTRGELWVCGQLDAGAVIGRGRGVQRPRMVAGAWVAGGVAPGGSVRLFGPVGVFAELAGVVAMTRAAFELADSEGLYKAGAVAARLMLGLELRFLPAKPQKSTIHATSAGLVTQ